MTTRHAEHLGLGLAATPPAEPSVRVATWNRVNSWPTRVSRAVGKKSPLPIFVVAIIFFMFVSRSPGDKATVIFLAAVFAMLFYEMMRTNLRSASWDRPRRAVPWDPVEDGLLQFDVEMDIVQGDAITGSDTGMLWVEGGALCFAGSATSFAIKRDLIDWESQTLRRDPVRPFYRSVVVPLKPFNGVDQWRVQFDVPVKIDQPGSHQLQHELERFSEATDSGQLEQLPPLDIGPAAFTDKELSRLAAIHAFRWFCFTILPIVALLFFVIVSRYRLWYTAFLAGGICNFGYEQLRLSVKAKKDLKAATGRTERAKVVCL